MVSLPPMHPSSYPDVVPASSAEEDIMPPWWPSAAKAAIRSAPDAPFPYKLLEMLNFVEGYSLTHIVGWLPHGNAFKINDKNRFMTVARRFFKATKIRSFTRQLNLWGFKRTDRDEWCHESFIRGRPELIGNIVRTKVKSPNNCRRATEEAGDSPQPATDAAAALARMLTDDEDVPKGAAPRRVTVDSAPNDVASGDPLQRLLDRRKRYGPWQVQPKTCDVDEPKTYDSIDCQAIDPLPFEVEREEEEAPHYDEFSSFIDQVGIRDPSVACWAA